MLVAKGYRLVTDPDQAHYRLQVNVLYVGKASQAAIDQAVYGGFGGPLAGMAVGGVIAGSTSNSPLAPSGRAAIGGGGDLRRPC
jgi:hypothetical protein